MIFLKCICDLLYPQAGTMTVGGKVIGKEVDYPENIGFIIESPEFLPGYSGLKNLKYLASIRGKVQEDEIRKYMELVGLNPDGKKHVGNLCMVPPSMAIYLCRLSYAHLKQAKNNLLSPLKFSMPYFCFLLMDKMRQTK